MTIFTKTPLVISIVGPAKIGVTATCQRVKFALENIGYTAKIIAPRTLREVITFEQGYKNNAFGDCDVILIDNHHYTSSAIRTGRKDISFADPEAIKPTISVLLVTSPDDYAIMLKMPHSYDSLQKCRHVLDKYQNCDRKVFGCNRLSILTVPTGFGRLECAGKVKNMIVEELKRAK